jgi:hypothetical protein
LEVRNARRIILLLTSLLLIAAILAACSGGGDDAPAATPTPSLPGPEDAIAGWVAANRSVGYVGDCANANRGEATGKLCSAQVGERGKRRAYALGPTFSEPTALAIVEDTAQGWTIYSVENNDPNQQQIPGIDWPLEVGDRVIVIGLGEGDCLSIREQPSQEAERQICMADGTSAIVQEGPVDAEGFTWWRISGEGFSGWGAGTWLRLEEAIRDALNPPTPAATATAEAE